jgi:hypothetical protein
MTQQLLGKFRSKQDFFKYFSENRKANSLRDNPSILRPVQLYVPPEKMVNKDFLKLVLAEEKKLLHLNEVKYVNVPHYDELSVKKFWPILQSDLTFMQYLPAATRDGRLPDRVYFWNVANTVQHAYVQKVIEHANLQRMAAQPGDERGETIEISDAWWDKLNAVPFVSCKCLPCHLCLPLALPASFHLLCVVGVSFEDSISDASGTG